MKASEFINKLRADGRYSFSIDEALNALNSSKIPTLNAIHRLKQHKLLISPAKGFYLIIPPEYQSFGCLPADMFISDLMSYFKLPYYVGFLSAAQFYGAAHQKPQRFQVVTVIKRRPTHCGRIYIEFIANKNTTQMPVNQFNTLAGRIQVATPEVIALDLVSAPQHAAGINNVATILVELAENINAQKLTELTHIQPELFWIQRLGYLLDLLGFQKLSQTLAKTLKNKNLHWVRLVSRVEYKNIDRNKKWKIIVNTTVEPD